MLSPLTIHPAWHCKGSYSVQTVRHLAETKQSLLMLTVHNFQGQSLRYITFLFRRYSMMSLQAGVKLPLRHCKTTGTLH